MLIVDFDKFGVSGLINDFLNGTDLYKQRSQQGRSARL